MKKIPVAYQVYSARDEAEKDLLSVLKALSGMGYDGVEFAGFYGNSAQDIKAMLKETGLRAISSHVPLFLIEQDMAGVIAFHKEIGCEYIAIPYLDDSTRPGAAGFAGVLKMIYQFGALCREAGIQLLYHNHDFEFVTLSGMYGLDFLYAATPEDVLKTEIDVCWVKYAGLNPAEYVKQYAGRCPIVHLKDYVGVKGESSPYGLIGQEERKDSGTAFEFRPFGHGCQKADEVVAASIEAGAQWFVIEQDLSVGRTPLEAAKMSIDTLKTLGVK